MSEVLSMRERINSIDDISRLILSGEDDWSQYGDVRASYSPYFPLISFCYNQTAFFKKGWNWFEENSRGIIFNLSTGELVSRPYKKFFNYGEHGIAPTGKIKLVQEKMDGSLGVPYIYNGDVYFATKGSFTSSQSTWATTWINHPERIDLRDQIYDVLYNGFTPLFEIIYPQNRIVVDYGSRAELVLLSIIHNETGTELVLNLSRYWSGSIAETHQYTIDEMITLTETLPASHEGWVVTFEDGVKSKIKGAPYLRAHKLLSNLSFSTVLESRTAGTFNQMIEGVPDEFLSTVMFYSSYIDETIEQISDYLSILIKQAPVQEQDEEYRVFKKRFAEWANEHGKFAPYLFAIEAGKDILPLIYRREFEDSPLTESDIQDNM